MVERLLLVALLSVIAVVVYYALRIAHMRRIEAASTATGQPVLLYFRTDTCAVCPTQGRYLTEATAEWDGYVQVKTVDAEREAALVSQYQIFTVPTTVLLDAHGQVSAVNYGLTDTAKLLRQLRQAAGQSASQPSQLSV